MNTTILQKCVDELKKETPNLQYVLGRLETLIEMAPVTIQHAVVPDVRNITRTENIADESTPIRSPITDLGPIANLS